MEVQRRKIFDTDRGEFLRLPGLFRRFEFEQLFEPGFDFRIEDQGQSADGAQLFAIYVREHERIERG